MRQFEDSQCTIDEEYNKRDLETAQKCSTLGECYILDSINNKECSPNEHCATWVVNQYQDNEEIKYGCILSIYCESMGNVDGELIEYSCPLNAGRETEFEGK